MPSDSDERIQEKRTGRSPRDRDGDQDRPKSSGGGAMTIIFLGGIAVAVTVCVAGGIGGHFYWRSVKTAEERQARIEKEDGVVITAEDMGRKYAENELEGDAKFKDKIITVTGRITHITSDSVRLAPGGPPEKFVIGGVYCTFGDEGQVANLRLNDRVTIRGYCTGRGVLETGKLIHCKKIN